MRFENHPESRRPLPVFVSHLTTMAESETSVEDVVAPVPGAGLAMNRRDGGCYNDVLYCVVAPVTGAVSFSAAGTAATTPADYM